MLVHRIPATRMQFATQARSTALTHVRAPPDSKASIVRKTSTNANKVKAYVVNIFITNHDVRKIAT